ncbi:uncharacterized protein LOC134701739 [Mytilus trossulus]|uniref:uncharacterized protein LOC134701739 n=1 Tax=Mytilus trossulus TaxID=6551 RepID=UPI003006786B
MSDDGIWNKLDVYEDVVANAVLTCEDMDTKCVMFAHETAFQQRPKDEGVNKLIIDTRTKFRTNKKTEIHARLLKQYKDTIEASVEEGAHEAVKENTGITILYKRIEESKELETVTQQPNERKHQVTTESQVERSVTSQQRNQALEKAKMDIETMLKSNVDFHDKEEYATLLLWDFAGDEEFYHTHQTFLSSDAIYLVVTKLNEADDKNAQDLFQLWMDSIHCYSRLEQDNSSPDDSKTTSDDLDPPVVIIGTWKDAVTSDEEEIEDACRKKLFTYTEKMTKDERGHIRCDYLISNTEDNNNVFQQIRQDIVNLARTMRTWNIDYPLKFIQLEQRLQEKKKELPIISYQEIRVISSETPNPLIDKELMLYLLFHHEIRALVYFKDLPDFIILDTQWLSDAFKCIITAEKFRARSIKHQEEWKEFLCKGKLHWEVVEDIFKKEQNILYKHKDHVLNVMDKFDIIIHPNISERDTADNKPCYYVPCMIKEEPECDIYEMFNVTEGICKKSTWLCFMFRFLPPPLINHLIAALSRKYEVAQVAAKQQKKHIALFRGSAVFELQKTKKLRKLLVMKCSNVIQIQVWQFGKHIKKGLYKYIADYVTDEMTKLISTRFKMSNVKFEKKWECGLTKPEFVTGSNNFSEEEDTIYYCETCTTTHEFTDEWSDLQHRITYFTNEEINFTKMGMVALNILTDVLYDLLKPDKQHLRPRSDCDITYLYSEHRRLNKHIPTNGWGGVWNALKVTDIAIGDDIERIRLTRNDLQHSGEFELGDTRFNELCNILSDLLKRFDQCNKPARLYTDHLNTILTKTISAEEVDEILGMDIEVEIIPTQ